MSAQAGIATIDITPSLGIELFGYHRAKPSNGILDPLYATALMLTLDETHFLLISIESVGMQVPHVDEIRAAAADETGLATSQVMVCFTHTHSAPDADSDNELSNAYRRALTQKIREVAANAAQSIQPCTVGWGLAHSDIGVNRRERDAQGRAKQGVNPQGVVDDRVGILSLHHAETGKRLALIARCTAHANVLRHDNLLISGDFPGWTRAHLSEALGCPVIVLIGAAGDCNPRWRGTLDDLEKVTNSLSSTVLKVLPAIQPQPITHLRSASTHIELELEDIPDPDRANHLAHEAAESWEVDTRAWLAHMTALHQQGQRHLSCTVELQALRINEGRIIGSPMEAFGEYALKIAHAVGNDRCFFNGYTNGYIGYLPTVAEKVFGGYEIDWMPIIYGLGTGYLMPVKAQAEQHMIDAALEIIKRL